jgi:DNA-binding CsgD family transcriptional regulator
LWLRELGHHAEACQQHNSRHIGQNQSITLATPKPQKESPIPVNTGDRASNPQNFRLINRTIERALAERSSFTLEYRAIRADGRVRTLRSRGDVVVDDSGQPIRLVGIAQDITDAKLAREALQNASADLERRATELQQLALRTATEPQVTPHAPLTPRQQEILRLIAQGLTNPAIAERLVITEGTVKWHVKQILAKTGSSNRAEAIARFLGGPDQPLNPNAGPRTRRATPPRMTPPAFLRPFPARAKPLTPVLDGHDRRTCGNRKPVNTPHAVQLLVRRVDASRLKRLAGGGRFVATDADFYGPWFARISCISDGADRPARTVQRRLRHGPR